MSLVGMFFVRQIDDATISTGEIVSEVCPHPCSYLIRIDFDADENDHQNLAHEVMDLASLLKRREDGTPEWLFFKTKRELDAFIGASSAQSLEEEKQGLH